MPEKRLPMRRIREVLRLHFEAKLNERQIAKICSVGKGTVRRYLKRIVAAGLSWPLPADIDDATLEQRMFPPTPAAEPGSRPLPDFTVIHKELKSRQNVTLQLLWEEHHQAYPEGYNYSWFCELYRKWSRNLDIVLRQEHRAGEKTFVDHAGQTVPVSNPRTGEVREAYVFVAVLGASSYTYAEATWTRNLWDWCGSHVRAFEYFQGTSRLIVPDNWKSGVKKPCYYEPELNRTYNDLAIHYGVGILPARPRRARDKAWGEGEGRKGGVQQGGGGGHEWRVGERGRGGGGAEVSRRITVHRGCGGEGSAGVAALAGRKAQSRAEYSRGAFNTPTHEVARGGNGAAGRVSGFDRGELSRGGFSSVWSSLRGGAV